MYDTAVPTTTSTNATAVAAASTFIVLTVFALIISIFIIVCLWRVFTKAGKPGWASIIPIYNTVVLMEIIGRPIWWIFLLFIPFVNVVVSIIVNLDLAASYGKSALFGVVGLIFFPYIALPMLAFGSAKYVGPAALAASTPVAPTPPPAAV